MRVPGEWAILFTKTPVPPNGQTEWRCNWCGWTVRVTGPTEPLPSHECPGPQPKHEPKP